MDDFLALIIITPIVYLLWRWFNWYTDMETVRRHLKEARERSEMRKAAVNEFLDKVYKFMDKIFLGK